MKKETLFLKILLSYLRYRVKNIVAFAVVYALFFFIGGLYHVNMEAISYAALLSFAFLVLLTAYDVRKYLQKHLALRDALDNITVTLDCLPEPSFLLEENYHSLLHILAKDRSELVSKADANYQELIDYYTLWAHQIKTPISAMRLLLQVEEETPYIQELELELFKIEQYVDMVLQYLRINSMSSDLVLKECALEDIVRQAVKKCSLVFIRKKIALRLDDFSCRVLTDEKWLGFVLEQLFSNALKYTNEGSVTITLAPGSRKILIIEDTGIGIHPEDVPRIFDRGFTGYNGRMDKKSTGIGLYLCREILQKLSHTIRFVSKPGKGTRVFLDLTRDEIEIE